MEQSDRPTQPDEATRHEDEADATRAHAPDREATGDEEAAADAAAAAIDDDERRSVAEHEKEMLDLGAHAKGEGEIR